MSFVDAIKPKFWDHEDVSSRRFKHLFDFRRIWYMVVLVTSVVVLLSLICITMIGYTVTQRAIESENLLRTSRLVSNARRTIHFFLLERTSAIDFIVSDNTFDDLNDAKRMAEVLRNLKQGFGGFADLGVIDARGRQRTYVGPYQLEGKDYSGQAWFKEVLNRGVYISDIFLGFRNVPHIVIAVKKELPNGSFFVVRASLDTKQFNMLLSELEMAGKGDAFIINHEGLLQTPSRYHGQPLEKIALPIPEYQPRTGTYEAENPQGEPLIIGFAYIEDTPFIMMVVKQERELMATWYRTRVELIVVLAISIVIVLLVIMGVSTYLVEKIYLADQKRVMSLHQVEYSNKMASIGRLSAGVAHEINNPLAIINEKAGLIKDIFTYQSKYSEDPKVLGLVNAILLSVKRCGRITKRLLNFARHMDVSIEPVNLGEVIDEVLSFLSKEAEYRCIEVTVDVEENIPEFVSDRGKLQQIFLNLVNNAFAAVGDGGHLAIKVIRKNPESVRITVTDDGCGIPESDIKRVFEPFFSTKTERGGTGLGLSITYGLVREIHGHIFVKSQLSKGTSFIITLPLRIEKKKGKNTCEFY